MTVASVDIPHKANDAKLLGWWQQSSNKLSGIVSQYCAIGAAVFFVVLMNYFTALAEDHRFAVDGLRPHDGPHLQDDAAGLGGSARSDRGTW